MTRPAVVRVAPSPTGDPHVGTAYIALFDYALARTTGGRFILRVEDTDRARYDAASEGQIIESLRWLGLDYDEGPDVGGPNGPYRQSERTAIYREHVDRLLENGWAYHCFCTPERLAAMRQARTDPGAPIGYDGHCRDLASADVQAKLAAGGPFVVRLAVPKDRTVSFVDALRGKVEIEGKLIDDQVLLKSDGFPTYHLANVVDDHLMEVNEVIRAEEWITSTPKHVLLYEAFGWEQPGWRHMPLLRNKDKSKISKRKNPTSLIWYKEQGYLPEALVNFLGLMGYSHPEGREVFSLTEMLATFDPKRISTTSPVFDLDKLLWLNGEYVRALAPEDLAARLLQHLAYRRERGLQADPQTEGPLAAWIDAHGGFESEAVRRRVLATVPLIRERIKTLQDYAAVSRCLYLEDVSGFPAGDLVPKKRTLEETRALLGQAHAVLAGLGTWSAAALQEALEAFGEEAGWKKRDLFHPLRVAVTGTQVSPPLFESMELIGREPCLARVQAAARA